MTKDLVPTIAELMSTIDRPGAFFASGSRICPMPGLEVDGVGPIAMPVLPYQGEQLVAAAEAAPYGRGADTLVDETVRRTWQIDTARIRVTDAVWASTLAAIVGDVAEQLGAGDVRADLYKMLVYDSGSFFVPHRDTEKVHGMFATLVVCLPSPHEGGEMVIRHQAREETIDLRNADVTRVTYAAFYADCMHEIRPILRGHRVCLVYNLVRDGKPLEAPDHRQPITAVTGALRAWGAGADGPLKLLYVLEHHYTPAGLSFGGLKNQDEAAAQVLVPAAQAAGCIVHLAMVSIHEEGAADPVEYGRSRRGRAPKDEFEIIEILERRQVVEDWRTPADNVPNLAPLPWEDDEVCPTGALAQLPLDEQYFTEATGNEGGSFERTYRRAAIVLWPENRRLALAIQAGVEFALPLLSELPEAEAWGLATTLAADWPERLSSSEHGAAERATLLDALARLGATRQAAAFFDVVVTESGYDGTENAAIVACWNQLDRRLIAPRVAAVLSEHLEDHTEACADLLDRLVPEPAADPALRPLGEITVAHLPRDHADHRWRPPVASLTVDRLLAALSRIGDADLIERAARHLLLQPGRYPIDAVLVPLAIALGDRAPSESLRGATVLRSTVLAHLRARVALPLEPPGDWSREAAIECTCTDCKALSTFLAHPGQDRWELQVAEHGRRHVESHGRTADVDFTTIRRGSPHTLVATKNQRSYERRTAERSNDLRHLARLDGPVRGPAGDGA